jgi:hypothetical protein
VQDDGMTLGEAIRDETTDGTAAPSGGAEPGTRSREVAAGNATAAADDDVVALYRLLLARSPSEADRAARRGLALARLAADMLASREFERNVAAVLGAGGPLPHEARSGPAPPADLVAWAERRLLGLAAPDPAGGGGPPRLAT